MPKAGEINDYYDKISSALDNLNSRIKSTSKHKFKQFVRSWFMLNILKSIVDTNQDVFIGGKLESMLLNNHVYMLFSFFYDFLFTTLVLTTIKYLNIAYRDLKSKVNTELKDMKYKMSADKIKEKQEQKLKLVEKERDWFRDEALRLNRK